MIVIFHANQLSYRGTSNALYNYAQYNKSLLGNTSIIVYNKGSDKNDPSAIEKFQKKFKVIGYYNKQELDHIALQEKADVFYIIKAGRNDGILVNNCKCVIHVVFKYYEPHGDAYAYVSEWLTQEMTQGKSPYVPHMIHVDDTKENLRSELNIPKGAIVFGRHGGADTFNLKFVHQAIRKIAAKRKDIYFLFLGTNSFSKKWFFKKNKNIIFLPSTTNSMEIAKFINTCDAYLHARKQGESFGIAIGEFSVKNKPIITWTGSKENSHIEILGNKAILYSNKKEIIKILNDFKPNETKNWNAYSKKFSPKVVMQQFKNVFLDS